MKSVTCLAPAQPVPVEGTAQDSMLDLVVPFTTYGLTQQALDAANRLGTNLNAHIRLVRPVVVPYPLELEKPPVLLEFLRTEMERLHSAIAPEFEIQLTRDGDSALRRSLRQSSVVILATKKRPWMTRTERLARAIRRTGHAVVMAVAGQENGTMLDIIYSLLIVAFFIGAWYFTRACERL